MDLKDLRGIERREFIRWSALVATLIGVERTRHLEVLSKVGGVAMADAAGAAAKILKTIHIVDGNGGVSNWTLPFPNSVIATTATATFSSHAPGLGVKSTKTERPSYYSPEASAVFEALPNSFQVTQFTAGTSNAHSATPPQIIGGGAAMIAAIASIQTASSTLVPSMVINAGLYGAAPGAPAPAVVPNAAGLIGIFNSQAAATLLKPAGNPEMLQKYHSTFLSLNAASKSPTSKRHFDASKVAVNLLGKQLGDALTPTPADLAMYGIDGTTPPAVANMSRAIITTLKAMAMGLTNQVALPGFNNDPHGMFANGKAMAATTAGAISKMLKGLYTHADSLKDPASGKKISEGILMTVHGDTMKNPFNENGWGDGSQQNVLYVIGNSRGRLKSGAFGGYVNPNTPADWIPETGETVARGGAGSVTGAASFASASAAVAYAVCGDMRRVGDFYRGPDLSGVTNISLV